MFEPVESIGWATRDRVNRLNRVKATRDMEVARLYVDELLNGGQTVLLLAAILEIPEVYVSWWHARLLSDAEFVEVTWRANSRLSPPFSQFMIDNDEWIMRQLGEHLDSSDDDDNTGGTGHSGAGEDFVDGAEPSNTPHHL